MSTDRGAIVCALSTPRFPDRSVVAKTTVGVSFFRDRNDLSRPGRAAMRGRRSLGSPQEIVTVSVILVSAAVLVCACQATPPPSLATGAVQTLAAPTSVASPIAVNPADLEYWTTFRQSFGLRADPEWVLAVATLPAAANDTGVPLLPSELTAVGNSLRQQRDMTAALMTYGESVADVYAGVYSAAGKVVLLVTDHEDVHRSALELLMDGRTGYQVRRAKYSLEELDRFAAEVNAKAAWFKTIGATYGEATPDIAANKVGVVYLGDADTVKAVRNHFGNPDWISVHREGPRRWAGPRGALIVKAVDNAGRPVANAICVVVPDDPDVSVNSTDGFNTDQRGICRAESLPAVKYTVRVVIAGNIEARVLGETRAAVAANDTTRVRIVVARP